MRDPSEALSVDAEMLQSIEQQKKRGSTASSGFQVTKSPLDAAKGEEGEEKQEEEDNDGFIHSGSEDRD